MSDIHTRPCDETCTDNSVHDSHLTAAGEAKYTNPPADRNIFHNASTARQVMGELAGYTSLCWKDRIVKKGKYGRPDKTERVFDSERAGKAVDDALVRLQELGIGYNGDSTDLED